MSKSANRDKKRLIKRLLIGSVFLALPALLIANSPQAQEPNDSPPATAQAWSPDLQKEIVRNGKVGFVVTEFAYALGPDAKDSGACPAGMTGGVRGLVEALGKTPAGQRQDGENEQTYERRLSRIVNTAPNGQNLCLHPDAGNPDPGWRMVSGRDLKVAGIDLDGRNSANGRRPAAGTCAHGEFQGTNGEHGIDNQFYRVVGCTTGFQSNGQANGFQIEMLTGSWGILISLNGVDDLQNDPEVEVSISANSDPIQLSPDRKALQFATYAVDGDPRYRAKARGRIVNGVLTTNPTDMRFRNVVAAMYTDRVLRDGRLRLTFTADGGMEGYLAGYTPVDAMYDLQYGARSSRTAKGDLAPERNRMSTSMGRAGALGHSCNGAYYALKQAADGHPDANGSCTSISTQYRLRVTPAFVVDAKTQSVNAPLAMR